MNEVQPVESSEPQYEIAHKYDFEGDGGLSSIVGSSFLPRLQLQGAQSDAIKSEQLKTKGWSLVGNSDEIDWLGKQVEIWVFTFRFKAMDVSDKNNIIAVFDRDSDEWRRIQSHADSGGGKDYFYGPEFLCYVPMRKKFATLLMGSATARREASKFGPIVKGSKKATISYKLISNNKHTWDGPTVVECQAPLEGPTQEELLRQVEDFNNPKTQKGAEAAPEESERDAVRQ